MTDSTVVALQGSDLTTALAALQHSTHCRQENVLSQHFAPHSLSCGRSAALATAHLEVCKDEVLALTPCRETQAEHNVMKGMLV